MLGAQEVPGQIVVSELSFRGMMNVFSGLVLHMHEKGERKFNTGEYSVSEDLRSLSGLCFRAEELRNTTLHSSWIINYVDQEKLIRKKSSSRPKTGFRVVEENVDSGYLLDIADYIIYAAFMVEQFMVEISDADMEAIQRMKTKSNQAG